MREHYQGSGGHPGGPGGRGPRDGDVRTGAPGRTGGVIEDRRLKLRYEDRRLELQVRRDGLKPMI